MYEIISQHESIMQIKLDLICQISRNLAEPTVRSKGSVSTSDIVIVLLPISWPLSWSLVNLRILCHCTIIRDDVAYAPLWLKNCYEVTLLNCATIWETKQQLRWSQKVYWLLLKLFVSCPCFFSLSLLSSFMIYINWSLERP